MKESDMQTLFGKYIKLHSSRQTEIYELKICKGISLPFDSLQEHQVQALLDAENSSFYHRITDQPWIENRPWTYTLKKPFDCFILVKVKSFVVVWYYKPRKPKVFIKIPIKSFLYLRNNSKRRSLKEEDALSIGIPFVVK